MRTLKTASRVMAMFHKVLKRRQFSALVKVNKKGLIKRLVNKKYDHQSHQRSLEMQMTQVRVATEGTKLTVMDYAKKLGISGLGIENIRELFKTGRF